jgi:hypothetical protein
MPDGERVPRELGHIGIATLIVEMEGAEEQELSPRNVGERILGEGRRRQDSRRQEDYETEPR